jgi:NAD(P)-dependent dehydrogenase (short-subunit alcohol dehydrogenase family)
MEQLQWQLGRLLFGPWWRRRAVGDRRPEEIASVVGFVAGEGASYLTATTIFADGGIIHNSIGL